MWSAISGAFSRVLRRPIVRHGIKSFERFSARLGWQFAGALTYFSLLALVPILMVAFSVAGFVLASRPATPPGVGGLHRFPAAHLVRHGR